MHGLGEHVVGAEGCDGVAARRILISLSALPFQDGEGLNVHGLGEHVVGLQEGERVAAVCEEF